MKGDARVLVIGGGFSGSMTAVQLARRDIPSLVIDPADRPARGVAYSTTAPHHRLNVRASNMSALPDQPDGFASFIAARRGASADSFPSRMDYGDYLEGLIAEPVAKGLVTIVQGRATHARPVEGKWRVRLETGESLSGDALVLALGNATPAPLSKVRGTLSSDDLVENIWSPRSADRIERAALKDEPVLIVGTGLTMVDALLSLDAAGHRGEVTALSRHGLLPHAHAVAQASAFPKPTLEEIPISLSGMLGWLRQRAKAEQDWRTAVDSLRPITQQLWQRMDRSTKERFLRHGRARWDVHRHRLAPDVHRRLTEITAQGRLRVIAGRLIDARLQDGGYAIGIALRHGGTRAELQAGLVINCTGPLASVRHNPDPLVVQMLSEGLLRPDQLDVGAELGPGDRLAGFENVFAVGPIARGRYWEIVAVPDLRVKAARIAETIATALASADLQPA